MKDKEKQQLAVVNLFMLLQQVVFKIDEVQNFNKFNTHRTKNACNALQRIILTDHKNIINAFWGTEGVEMQTVTRVLDEFYEAMAKVQYHKLPELTEYILTNEHLTEI